MNESEHAAGQSSQSQNETPRGPATDSSIWLRLLVLLNIAVLTAVIIFLVRGDLGSAGRESANLTDAAELKATAEALEERGLDAQAADAWEQYFDAVGSQVPRAEVLGHIGLLRLRAEQFDQAAAAFVEAQLAAGDDKELKEKASAGLMQAYRAMGRFGAIGREMSRQAKGGSSDSSPAVAKIGDETLTEADLNRMVEHRVDQMLASQDALGDTARRQAFLRQLADPKVRAKILRELVQTELFVRRARELQLDKTLDFLLAREQSVDTMLVRRLLQNELDVQPPSEKDLKAYYDAHLAEFRQPDAMNVVLINTADEKTATELLAKIHSADEFRKLAQDPGKDARSFSQTLFRGRPSPLLGNVDPLFALDEGQWSKEPIVRQGQRFLVLVTKKEPAKTLSFDTVRDGLQTRYVQQQQNEAVDKLFADLSERYHAKLLLEPPKEIEGVSLQTDRMLGETGPADVQPAVPVEKPADATPKTPEEPKEKPEKPAPAKKPADESAAQKAPEEK